MKFLSSVLAAAVLSLGAAAPVLSASVTLYDQDFESPAGFVNGAGSGYSDLSQQQVNDLYANQPAGFTFEQAFTVETMLIGGSLAFGSGYSDPGGTFGSYAIGMLGSAQNDLLGLSFNVGDFDFFNFRVDISSIGLHGGPGSPFASASDVPIFRFRLYDNPLGTATVGGGTLLDEGDLTGVASELNVVAPTRGIFSFDASGSTNGNVTLQIDLIQGGYGIMDNFLITASDTAGGGIDVVPVPASLPLLLAGLGGFGLLRRRRG
ncbi:hypothetical protein GCM10011360_30080 [Primorskyibacter flagellatus]|uniref:VPLPA-CTERM protein sorting domain-containing protein n=1 Tax=Primorskyibacter flagellatus TaxID=1387277 RepID=A0A917EH19_9RHOB|nr:VPLPA-CTERM sorting domain-containing protein [Primorskyibacter flagellatus]GGE40443.1 hypothetical protein GCM10011360_30080 [Primorskyibacter flagellatus]